MQGTRVLFNSKEDAIAFAEKQGQLVWFLVGLITDRVGFRLGLLCSTTRRQTYPPKELQARPFHSIHSSPKSLRIPCSENYVYKPHKLRIVRTK